MESITNNEFLNSVLESEAWKEVSSRESFSMEMIEKFADKVNWGRNHHQLEHRETGRVLRTFPTVHTDVQAAGFLSMASHGGDPL